MPNYQPILNILPEAYRRALALERRPALEELRLRAAQPPTVLSGGKEEILPLPSNGGLVSRDDLELILRCATKQSAYAAGETLRQGFLTLPGGHRIGVCGTAVTGGGTVRSLKEVSSLAIRVARSIAFAPGPLLDALSGSALIIGPPGCGKTTLLRGCVNALCSGGFRVGVVDEREEIAACVGGVPQLPLGSRADVVSGIGKEAGIMLLLRAMNVHWIAVDEITAPEDLRAMRTCSYCGVKLLATAHAASRQELYQRPLYRDLMQMCLFDRLIVLTPDKQWRVEGTEEC